MAARRAIARTAQKEVLVSLFALSAIILCVCFVVGLAAGSAYEVWRRS